MNLYESLIARCYDGTVRTGKVIYIHPDHIFATLEFEGLLGNWRESIMLRRSGQKAPEETVYKHQKPIPFTVEDDIEILKSKNMPKTAASIGRKEAACYGRRSYLKKMMRRREK